MMLALLVAVVVSAPDGAPCSIEGQVRLLEGGKSVPAEGRVVVYVDKATPRLPPPTESHTHTIRQKERQFTPPLQVIVANDTVEFVNDDKTEHSVFSRSATDSFEMPASKKGKTGEKTFITPGPVMVQCDRHGWMRTDLLVVKNAYYAVVGAAGAFKISGLPPGKYKLVAWERNGNKQELEVKSCQGPATVEPIELGAAPEPERRHKDGTVYTTIYDQP